MGGKTREELKLQFDKWLKLEFRGVRITSDARLLMFRELDKALGLMEKVLNYMKDSCGGRNVQHELGALLGGSLYGCVRLAVNVKRSIIFDRRL